MRNIASKTLKIKSVPTIGCVPGAPVQCTCRTSCHKDAIKQRDNTQGADLYHGAIGVL